MPLSATVARAVLRGAIVVTAIVAIVRGDPLYGAYCLGVLALTTAVAGLTRRAGTSSLVAIDVALLTLLLLDMTLGVTLGLYVTWPWYDKALHFGSSTVIGLLGFLAIYIVHVTGRFKSHPIVDGIATLLVTLGLGALWEIAEYGVDHALGRATQGSPRYDALDDTMIDLMLDAIGAIVAALIGTLYLRYSKRSRERVEAVAKLLAGPAAEPR